MTLYSGLLLSDEIQKFLLWAGMLSSFLVTLSEFCAATKVELFCWIAQFQGIVIVSLQNHQAFQTIVSIFRKISFLAFTSSMNAESCPDAGMSVNWFFDVINQACIPRHFKNMKSFEVCDSCK